MRALTFSCTALLGSVQETSTEGFSHQLFTDLRIQPQPTYQHNEIQPLHSCHRVPSPCRLVVANQLHNQTAYMWRGTINITYILRRSLIQMHRTNAFSTATLTAAHLETSCAYATCHNPTSLAMWKPYSHAWTVNRARKPAHWALLPVSWSRDVEFTTTCCLTLVYRLQTAARGRLFQARVREPEQDCLVCASGVPSAMN